MKPVSLMRLVWTPPFLAATFWVPKAAKAQLLLYNAKVYTVDLSYPAAEAIAIDNAGVIVGVGTYDSLITDFATYTGQDMQGRLILPGFYDVLETVIPMLLINASQALHHNFTTESLKVSIKVGMFADLVVVDKDIFTIPVYQISSVKVVRTYRQGKITFDCSRGGELSISSSTNKAMATESPDLLLAVATPLSIVLFVMFLGAMMRAWTKSTPAGIGNARTG